MIKNKSFLVLIALSFLEVFDFLVIIGQKERNLEEANEILDKYPLIDGHNDLPHMIRTNFENQFDQFDLNDMKESLKKLNKSNIITHTDIKRMKEGKLRGQFWAIYASCESNAKDAIRRHLEQIDVVYRYIEQYSDFFKLVTKSEDIMKAFKDKKFISLLGLESGHAIDSSLAILRMFYALGVRYMTLTHNCNVPWATNNLVDRLSNASAYGGLTQFGRKVISEMNRLGMMVDLSHVSHQTMLDALEESKAPVIFSHSSVYALCNHTRNVRDDVLLKLKENNGIIMINFYNGFVACDPDNAVLSNVVDHIKYVKNLIGIDYIGIGGDYDGVPTTPIDLEDVSNYPNLVKALLEIGWSQDEIVKLIGGNLIRVLSQVEEISEKSKNIKPFNDIIDKNDLPNEQKKCRTSF